MAEPENPYIERVVTTTTKEYNPKYDGRKPCECGHSYFRHFDSYQDMEPVGCKYCGCDEFREETKAAATTVHVGSGQLDELLAAFRSVVTQYKADAVYGGFLARITTEEALLDKWEASIKETAAHVAQ